MTRPLPPVDGFDGVMGFIPAPELAEWAKDTFVADGGPLCNEEHAHLREAEIGFLWTDVENARHGRAIIGQAELGAPMGAMGRWARARALQQVREWFGNVPDFIITIDANAASKSDDASFCALVEHELYHCAQELDDFGQPKFRKDGSPTFGIRGHDVEEFVGVVRRYGIAATGVSDLVRVANKGPEIASASIGHACGTCLRRVA